MAFSEYTKQNLVQYIAGNEFPPSRSGRQLVALFNEFGCRDVYNIHGLPTHPNTGNPMSRSQYIENRLNQISDENIIGILNRALNESENKNLVATRIGQLILPEGYSITNNDGNYSVIGGVINRNPPVVNQAHFQQIENQILAVLDEAQVSIKLAIAWFTNERIKNKLLEKLNQGIEISIAIYDDGVNNRHGVDLAEFNVTRLRRGLRGGLMHDKFCVIDNQIVITGSYNWTDNAEFRNDENITVERDPAQATRYAVEFRRLTT